MNSEFKKQFRMVFERIGDPLLLVDTTGFILDFNPAARRALDIGDTEHIRDVVSTEKSFVFDANDVLPLLARSDSVHGVRLNDEEGNPADVAVDIIRLDNKRDERAAKLIHIKDFSSYRTYERWKDELVSMVAHEIKNPLSAMKNSMGILVSQATGPVTEDQNRLLQTSIRGIDRLTRLLDGFLDMSRIGAGKYTLEPRWVNMREFLPDVIDSFRTLFNVHRQTLSCDVHAEIEKVFVDAPKLEQVLINLLSNAVKFTPDGGDIVVSVERASREAMSEELRILNWGEITELRFIRIRVTDTGIGMTGETMSHLFTRYYRKGDGGGLRGSHLGLSISKTLTEVQYGSLKIESEPGVGTEATVYLPEDENTALVLSRIGSMERCLARAVDTKKDALLLVIEKSDDVQWADLFAGWQEHVELNPAFDKEKGASHVAWALGKSVAALLASDVREGKKIKSLLENPDSGSVPSIGECRVPQDGTRAAKLIKLARNKIKNAPPARVRP